MKKLMLFIYKLPIDKQQHLYLGAVVGFVLSVFINYWIAWIIVMALGGLKELYDHYHPDKHTCEFLDWLATAIGGCVPVVVYLTKLLICM